MIREYKESDFSAIENIYNLSKADEFSGEDFKIVPTPLGEDKIMLEQFYSSKIYIYETAGIAGFIGVRENFISWLFVHPRCRGRGIGKKLVSFMLSALSGEVSLTVARSNLIAKKLYESLGFRVQRELTSSYQENSLVVCRMVAKAKSG